MASDSSARVRRGLKGESEMLLVLSQEHKEHLGFLASVDVAG